MIIIFHIILFYLIFAATVGGIAFIIKGNFRWASYNAGLAWSCFMLFILT